MPLNTLPVGAYAGVSETLTLRQQAAGTWTVATQSMTEGANTDTPFYGVVVMVETGIDGVNVRHGDLDVWCPLLVFEGYSVTPVVGNVILRGSTQLRVQHGEPYTVQGLYRLRARAAV